MMQVLSDVGAWSAVLAVVGLLCTAWGAHVTAQGVKLTPAQAQQIAASGWGGGNQGLANALVKQSKRAMCGLYLIALGTALQVFAVVLAQL